MISRGRPFGREYPGSPRGPAVVFAWTLRAILPLFLSVHLLSAAGVDRSAPPTEGTADSTRSVDREVRLRRSILETSRKAKVEGLEEYKPSWLERGLLFIEQKRVMEYIRTGFKGLYPRFGGLTTGSGFAVGPAYRRRLLSEEIRFNASAT